MNQAFSNPISVSNTEVLEEIVKEDFRCGFLYKEIIHFLETFHGKPLSIRTLHRILRSEGLYRKTHSTDSRHVIQFVENEISESGSSLGYRQLHQRCINQGLKVTRKNVSLIMKQLDPEGVVRRQRHQLQRRKYYSKGPNYVWHLDGYDKLKPFGFAIHVCIDGYTRKVLWLSLLQSNKDPKLVCHLFTDYLRSLGGVPRKIMGDRGTENVHFAAAQRFLLRNHTD